MTRLANRARSFKYAFSGIVYLFTTQPNLRIHAAATVLVVILGFVFGVTLTEWCILILAIGFVIAAEAFNTAVEVLTDLVSPGYHEKAKIVKDVAAAGVLISAIAAAVTGGLIFGPRIWLSLS
jgi:diacylglycerol kinase (ATP)